MQCALCDRYVSVREQRGGGEEEGDTHWNFLLCQEEKDTVYILQGKCSLVGRRHTYKYRCNDLKERPDTAV